MTAPSITRGLTLAVDPASSSARVEIPTCLGFPPFVATVRPAADGDGWLVSDPTDEEPICRATFAQAIDLALAVATSVLAERLGWEAYGCDLPAAGPRVREPADIC